MEFSEGQTVVHPHHGPTTVVCVSDRRFRDRARSYVTLRVHGSELAIDVPVDAADEVGLRPVSDGRAVAALLDVLRSATGPQQEMWSRRMKENTERLRSGELLVIAGVVRDLARRQRDHGISAGEKDLLKLARHPLITELALALTLTREASEAVLDHAILGDAVLGDAPGEASMAAAS
ncbi:CarD family transcriptional regulator [Actinotalea subterranea]|uniref:CarD family transcriptional regulator n=1 Tax=Actinotalea subterranea TaxID=2607497 RepID=UPI0011EC3376|nr:CarD family transcriptional regulator [Actinotalea subterranea]